MSRGSSDGWDVRVVRATLWVGLQFCLGNFVYHLCFESQRCWCHSVTYQCFPVSSPCQISEVGHPCLQLFWHPLSPAHPQSGNPLSLVSRHFSHSCHSSGATPWEVSAAEDSLENVLAKKNAEEELKIGVNCSWPLITSQLLQRRLEVAKACE